MTRVAALQIGPAETTAQTLANILAYKEEIISLNLKLVVMPEAVLGGYPKTETFGAILGLRSPKGREDYRKYYDNAVNVPGAETDELCNLSSSTDASLVIGVIERDGSTLYCTALFFDPKLGLVGKHRKLMPTGTERLIWGQGDGSTLPAIDSAAGKLGTAICWENFMPTLRFAMYAKGVQVWCAPTVDEREMWQSSMRHIAYEGRMFVVSAVQYQPSPHELGVTKENWEDQKRPLIRGGSIIVDPLGNIVAGPVYDKCELIHADIDLNDITRARYDFDPVGHYGRPDVFSLHVDESVKSSVVFK